MPDTEKLLAVGKCTSLLLDVRTLSCSCCLQSVDNRAGTLICKAHHSFKDIVLLNGCGHASKRSDKTCEECRSDFRFTCTPAGRPRDAKTLTAANLSWSSPAAASSPSLAAGGKTSYKNKGRRKPQLEEAS